MDGLTIWEWFIGARYRWWSRLLHRHGYHHTRTLYPQDEHGHVDAIARCDWCGISGPV